MMYPVKVTRTEQGDIADISVSLDGRTLAMHGPAGPQREMAFAQGVTANLARLLENSASGGHPASTPPLPPVLPVLLGSGAGEALTHILHFCDAHSLPLLVVDAESPILAETRLQERHPPSPTLEWVTEHSPEAASRLLTLWQSRHGGAPLFPCPHPFYQRLSRDFYAKLKELCEASRRFNFWQRVNYPRFTEEAARILILTSKYFLTGEITSACDRLHVPYRVLQLPDDEYAHSQFVEDLLAAVLAFRPDFAFTFNHLAVDREGVLVHLLEKLRLPLASWFVDNPHLVLSMYHELVSPWTALFTWDADNIASLEAMGFEHVRYLPLGTDVHRFTPATPGNPPLPRELKARVSFVGNSMVHKIAQRKGRYSPPPALVEKLVPLAADFSDSDERDIERFFRTRHPALLPLLENAENTETRLAFEVMLTWEATRQYRLSCISAIFPFAPLIVGDSGWHDLVPPSVRWRYHPELSYYSELPRFYPGTEVNFNCTSKQMKGAVNQRVFDVPATNSFLITDYREQVENLFEPGREIICYRTPEEATALVERYLAAPAERRAISEAARKRILAEHTYDLRLRSLIAMMRQSHG